MKETFRNGLVGIGGILPPMCNMFDAGDRRRGNGVVARRLRSGILLGATEGIKRMDAGGFANSVLDFRSDVDRVEATVSCAIPKRLRNIVCGVYHTLLSISYIV